MSVLQEVTFTNQVATREIIDEVVDSSFESVCGTMGPNGRYVVINNLNSPVVTKDGASVARSLDFGEPRRNMVASLIKEPSLRTDTQVGDGTTTTVFMTTKLYKAFVNSMTFKNVRFVDKLVKDALAELSKLVIKVDRNSELFARMLMTTANYEAEIVDRFLSIYAEYESPNVILKRNHGLAEDKVHQELAISFTGNFPSNAIESVICKIFNARVGERSVTIPAGTEMVIIDEAIESMFAEDMASMTAGSNKPIVLLARSWSVASISHIGAFMQQNPGAIILPYRIEAGGTIGTDIMNDIANVLGVNVSATLEGAAELIKASDVNFMLAPTVLLVDRAQEAAGKRANEIIDRIAPIYENMDVTARQTPIGISMNSRIGGLRGNNVVITVTGETQSDCNERYYRYEDVMKAAKTAIEFGVLPGIGWGYLSAAAKLEDEYAQTSLTQVEQELLDTFLDVLRSQYEYLTGYRYRSMDKLRFIDLTDGEESDYPNKVYDNAAAVMVALQGAWATAKTLGKLSTINGRGDKDYLGRGR